MSDPQQTPEHTAQTSTFQEKGGDPQKGAGSDSAPASGFPHLANFDRFLENVNGILASKENLKLRAIHENLNRAYYKKWSRESNLYFTLTVSLRKRRKKLADKS